MQSILTRAAAQKGDMVRVDGSSGDWCSSGEVIFGHTGLPVSITSNLTTLPVELSAEGWDTLSSFLFSLHFQKDYDSFKTFLNPVFSLQLFSLSLLPFILDFVLLELVSYGVLSDYFIPLLPSLPLHTSFCMFYPL